MHLKVRLGRAHSCVLVLLDVRLGGAKELIALAEGLRAECAITGAHLVALVRSGATFENGVLVEQEEAVAA